MKWLNNNWEELRIWLAAFGFLCIGGSLGYMLCYGICKVKGLI